MPIADGARFEGQDVSTEQRKVFVQQAESIVEMTRLNARLYPDLDVISFLDEDCNVSNTLTFSELDVRSRKVAAKLQKDGQTGKTVLILLPPGVDYFVAFVGCLYAGAIAVPLYPPNPTRLSRELPRLTEVVKDSKATCGITIAAVSTLVRGLLMGSGAILRTLTWYTVDKMLAASEGEWKDACLTRESTAFLQYSSGSTGVPKGVMVSHGNLLLNVFLMIDEFRLTANDAGLSWLPPYHDMGLIGGFLLPLCGGRTGYFISPLLFLKRPSIWLEAISKFQVSLSGAPNFAFELLCSKITDGECAKLDLSSWKFIFSGAEPVRATTIDKFKAKFGGCGFNTKNFRASYGLAEATLMVTMASAKDKEPSVMVVDAAALEQGEIIEVVTKSKDQTVRSLVGVGTTPSLTKVLIVDPETKKVLPEARVGEVWVHGGTCAQGYWNKPEKTKETFAAKLSSVEGEEVEEKVYMRTGDLGYLMEDELYICGRLKDMIIIRGRNHFPQDIEGTVEGSCPQVLRRGCSAAFAIEEDGSERLIVCVEVKPNSTLGPEERHATISAIREAVTEGHGLPVHAVLLLKANTINKTTSGKIQRFACRQGYRDNTLTVLVKDVIGQTEQQQMQTWGQYFRSYFPSSSNLASSSKHSGIQAEQLPEANQFKDLCQAGPELSVRVIQCQLHTAVANQLKVDVRDLDIKEPLSTYGFDSAAAVGLSKAMENAYGIQFPPRLLQEYRTIVSLAKFLALGEKEKDSNSSASEEVDLADNVTNLDIGEDDTTTAGPSLAATNYAAPPVAADSDDDLKKPSPSASHGEESKDHQSANLKPEDLPTPGVPCILGIGKANPDTEVVMKEFCNLVAPVVNLNEKQRERLQRICDHSGIETKYSVLSFEDSHLFQLEDDGDKSKTAHMEARNEMYKKEAPKLAHKAATRCLADWGGDKSRITHVVAVSCTGMIVPGLEFRLMRSLELEPDVQRLNIHMMGCFGALAGLKAAKSIATEDPSNRVLLLCCELCSLHFQSEENTENLVGSSLFADGAACVVVGADPHPSEKPLYELVRTGSAVIPETEELMTWDVTHTGFKMGLKPEIPAQIYKHVDAFSKRMLSNIDAFGEVKDIPYAECVFPIHPGGKAIVEAIEHVCALKPDQAQGTWDVLRKYGNMSSATLLFVLDEIRGLELPYKWGLALAFGPGLNIEGHVVRPLGARGRSASSD